MRNLKKEKSSDSIMEDQRKMKKIAEFILRKKTEKEKSKKKPKNKI